MQWDKIKVEGQALEIKSGFPRKIARSLVDIGFTDDHVRQIVNEGQSGKVEITSMGANRRLAFWTAATKVLDYLKVGACQIADPPVNSEVEPIDTSIYLGRHDISKTHEPHTSLALQVPFLISTRNVPNDWIKVRETLQNAAEQTGTAVLDSTGIAERSVDKVLKVGYIPTHITSNNALIVIGGNVGDRAFEQMSGGIGIVIRHGIEANEEIGQGFASGVFGGQIYMRASEQSVRNAIDCSNRKFIKIEPVISLSEGLHQILYNWSDEFGVNMKDLRDGWLRITSTRQGGEHYTE